MLENIENIKREIKEKIRNNPKYVHPCNKEFQEDIKRFGFNSGYDYITWMQQNGILRNPVDINRIHHKNTAEKYGFNDFREYTTDQRNTLAKAMGFDNWREYRNNVDWFNGVRTPMSENRLCHNYSGSHIAERKIARIALPTIFGNIKEEMRHNNSGYDFVMDHNSKVDVKSARLINNRHNFLIMHNNIADYFLLIGFNYGYNEKLEVLHMWLFESNGMIKKRIGSGWFLEKFYKREGFQITNDLKGLSEFEKYELKEELDNFKIICPFLED